MNTPVVLLAAIAVLSCASAGRTFPVRSENEDQLDAAGGETGPEQVPRESRASDDGFDAENLKLVEETIGNDLHDIRKREARSKERSSRGGEEPREGPEGDRRFQPNEKVMLGEIKDFLQDKKDKIINFMKPILDRIKHRPKKPSESDSPTPPTPPAPSTPSDINDSKTYPAIFSPYSFSSSKCGKNDKHRSMNTLSILFPDFQSSKGEQPFVFLPFTNTLMRVIEQEVIRESQSDEDSKRKLRN